MSFPRYEGYRDSGIDWISEIPSHWSSRRLKTLFKRVSRPPQISDEIVTAFRDGAVTLRRNRREDGFTVADKEIGYQGVRRGDLVIHAMDGFAGAIGVSDSDGKSTPVYSVCVPGRGALSEYFALILRHMALSGFVTALARGIRERSTEFRWADASVVFLPCPPIQEQKHIVSFVARESAKIDGLIQAQQQLIELLKEKRQAVILHAVTKGLDPTAPVRLSGIEWLGDVPAHWKFTKFRHLGSFFAGAGFPFKEQGVEGEELPFFKVADLGRADSRERLAASGHTISRDTARRLRAVIFPSSSIVFAKIGAALLLKCIRQIQRPSCLDNNMMGFIPGSGLDVNYGRYLFQTIEFSRIVDPGAVPSLSEGQVSGIIVAVPDQTEQLAITQHLDSFTVRTDALIAQAEDGIGLLQERRVALISAVVTGQIDVRKLISTSTAEAA